MKYDGRITKDVASFALDLLEVDKFGLDQNDRNILMTIIEKFQGGPVGLDTLAALRAVSCPERFCDPNTKGQNGNRSCLSAFWN